MFDEARSDSIPAVLKGELDAALGQDGRLSAMLREQLSLTNENGPLGQIHRTLVQLRDEFVRQGALEEIVEKTTAKGLDFEEVVARVLEATAANYTGDTVEDVRNVGSKAGDYLYHVAEGPVIAIEARNRKITSAAKVRKDM